MVRSCVQRLKGHSALKRSLGPDPRPFTLIEPLMLVPFSCGQANCLGVLRPARAGVVDLGTWNKMSTLAKSVVMFIYHLSEFEDVFNISKCLMLFRIYSAFHIIIEFYLYIGLS